LEKFLNQFAGKPHLLIKQDIDLEWLN